MPNIFDKILILFIFFSLIAFYQAKIPGIFSVKQTIPKNFIEIMIAINEFLKKNSNVNPEKNSTEFSKCIGFTALETVSTDTFLQMFTSTGKGLNERGLEDECIFANITDTTLAYYLFIFDLGGFESFTEDVSTLNFLNQTSFYIGGCLLSECKYFIHLLLDRTINEKFFNYLSTVNIKDISYEIRERKEGSHSWDVTKKNPFWTGLFLALLLLSVLFLMCGIISFYHKSSYDMESIEKDSKKEDDFYYDDSESDETAPKKRDKTIFTLPENEVNGNNSFCSSCLEFFNIFSGIKILSGKVNLYYDGTSLELISLFRVVFLFMITYYQNMVTLIKIPLRDLYEETFYKNLWFGTIKFSGFALDCMINLDGVIMMFKLMSFMKKNLYDKATTSPSLLTMLRFYSKVFSKFVPFFFLFFFANYFDEKFVRIFGANALFGYYKHKIHNNNYQSLLLKTIIPGYLFKLAYKKDVPNEFFEHYRYVIMLINEFYVFTFVFLLIYIGYKIRKQIYDAVIFLLVFANIAATYWSCGINPDEGSLEKKYTFNRVIGTIFSIRYPHIMFNTYMIGVFTGVALFHFKDILSKNPVSEEKNTYSPFKFLYFLMKCIDTLGLCLNYTFLMISFLVMVLASISFNLLFLTKYKTLSIDFNVIEKVIYYYEKFLFLVSFNVAILLLTKISNELSLKKYSSGYMNNIVPRVYISFLCYISEFLYGTYVLFKFQLRMTYQNILFITMGIFMFVFSVSLIVTIELELPIRKFTIWVQSLLKEKENIDDTGSQLDETRKTLIER